jgi:chaperonin GroEL
MFLAHTVKPENDDERIGVDIVKRAVEYPTRVLADNAGWKAQWVTRAGLQNAASIAGLLLTTECLVTEIPREEKPRSPSGAMGGMAGGMGTMDY